MTRPLDSYLPNGTQQTALDKAVTILANRCLARFHLPAQNYVLADPILKVGDILPKYGFIEEGTAAHWGYHPPYKATNEGGDGPEAARTSPDSQFHAQEILNGTVASYPGGVVPHGGCRGEALRTISGGAKWPQGVPYDEAALDNYIVDLKAESAERAAKDKRYLVMIKQWSACMARSGYTFASRDQVTQDPRWKTAEPSRAEIQVAVADSKCMTSVNYLGVFGSLVGAYDQQVIKDNAGRLAAVRAIWEVRLRNAVSVVADSRPS